MAVDSSVLRARITRWGQAVFDRSIELTIEELREAAPLGVTGETRRGIQAQPGGRDTRPAARIVSTGKGGSFVEEGTEPHIIVGRPILRFLWGGDRIGQPGPNQRIATTRGAGVVFFRSVEHPGFPPRPWFEPTVARWADTHLQQAAEAVAF